MPWCNGHPDYLMESYNNKIGRIEKRNITTFSFIEIWRVPSVGEFLPQGFGGETYVEEYPLMENSDSDW